MVARIAKKHAKQNSPEVNRLHQRKMEEKRRQQICKSCKDPLKIVNRPRGLCWRCYYDESIRFNFPPVARSGVASEFAYLDGDQVVPAAFPTNAAPGTEEKIRVMIERLSNLQELFHPDDEQILKPIQGIRGAGKTSGVYFEDDFED